jgi:hypothetical protein
MTTELDQDICSQPRRRKHFRGYRRLKVVLFAIGIAGLLIGLLLVGSSALSGNDKLFRIGIIYVFVFLAVIGLRGIITFLGSSRSE